MNVPKARLQQFLVPLCSLLLLLAAVMVPHNENRRRLRIAPGVWPGSEALLLAYAQKKLPEDRFQMIELPWSSAVMHALSNGAADVAVVSLDGVLRMREGGQQLRVLMVLDESAGADMLMTRKESTKVAELKGKRVGVDIRGVGAYLLLHALESAGMRMSDIQVVQLIQSEMQGAVESGEVDAVVVAEPWVAGMNAAGMHSVFDSKQLMIPIVRVLVASKQALEQFRPELTLLMQAQVEMTRLLRTGKPFPGMEMVLRREGVQFEDFRSGLNHWRPLNAEQNAAMLGGGHPGLVQMAATMEEQMLRGGLLRSRPAAAVWIDATLYREALP